MNDQAEISTETIFRLDEWFPPNEECPSDREAEQTAYRERSRALEERVAKGGVDW